MTRKIIFGEISGIKEGQWFEGRKEMMPSSFHRNWGAGIDGNGKEGTAAIVLSGGYEDDKDLGDEIIYTGAGGNDPNTKAQISDQTWDNRGNAGLVKSMNEGLPVRVIRGYTHESTFSPSSGYEYAGLFSVVDAWESIGKSGFKICRVELIYSGNNDQRKSIGQIELDHGVSQREIKVSTILRVVRDSKKALDIKRLYNYECQVCGIAIKTKSGFYAEGAHIKPHGRPHDGDDSISNLICLCPNCHVMFDKGTFSINNDLSLIGHLSGSLTVDESHKIDRKNLEYHRISHGYK